MEVPLNISAGTWKQTDFPAPVGITPRVLPGENVVDYIALTGAEFAVSEILFQNLVFIHVCLSKTKGGSFRLTAL